MSMFSAVEMAPRDPILGLNEQFNADTNPNKVNLGVGVYYDDNGKLPLLQCVQTAEKAMMEKPSARGYLPIDGIAAYDAAVKSLVFGADGEPVKSGRIATIQALGGTGGLKVGADFLKRISPNATVLISDPSWENHRALFTNAGFTVETYAYYDAAKRGVNFESMLAALNAAAAELPTLIAPLLQGNNMGLLSEAGTPCIADPGSQLVSLAHQHQIRVIPLSGPSSIFMALMASGFNGQQFRFLGYLPIDKSQRIATIKSLEKEATTLHNSQIFIETPYRNLSLFNDILRTCQSNTLLCIACNLTAENEFIQTKTIRQWETSAPNIHKINCVFIISS